MNFFADNLLHVHLQQVRSSAAEKTCSPVSVNSRDHRRSFVECVQLFLETVPFRVNNVSLEVSCILDVTILNWIIRTFSSPGETNRSLRQGNKRKRVVGKRALFTASVEFHGGWEASGSRRTLEKLYARRTVRWEWNKMERLCSSIKQQFCLARRKRDSFS